jgi:sugar lactone lactonase YvrE
MFLTEMRVKGFWKHPLKFLRSKIPKSPSNKNMKAKFFRNDLMNQLLGCFPTALRFLVGMILFMACGVQAQNLFVSDTGPGSIYEYTPGGAQSTFATSLSDTTGLAFNSAGDLFAADYGGASIKEFTPAGVQTTFASGLSYPAALAFNGTGNLFVTDWGSGNIYEYTPAGVKSTFATGGVGTSYGIAINAANDVFVLNELGGTVIEITPSGTQSTFATGLTDPTGLAFNSAGNLFVAQVGSIAKITPGGSVSTFASIPNAVWALAFNSAGNLFATDQASNDILEFTPNGTQSVFATGISWGTGLAFQPVSEPSTMALLVVGAVGLLIPRRRKARA